MQYTSSTHLNEYMTNSFQVKLFNAIIAQFPKRSEAVDAIGETLSLAKDAVYRRLRGVTVLTPDQLAELARQFNISIDALVGDTDAVFFTYNIFSTGIKDFEQFLMGYYRELEQATRIKGYRFYYASVELPLFQALFFPELIAFKLFIWGRTALDMEYLKDMKFDFSVTPYPVLKLIEEMMQMYITIPSTELWSQNIIDNTLNQIEYYVSCGSFKNNQDALVLCDRLTGLTHHMQLMAEAGRKFPRGLKPKDAKGAAFDLYHNEMVHTNNTILSVSPLGNVLYTTLSNPNFLRSTDQPLCEYMESWFRRIIAKSNSISNHAEKNRDWFFNRMRHKIEQSRQRIRVEGAFD